MLPSSGLTVWNLLTATGALLAFLIGMMTLVGRDRKSPYLINKVIAIFLFSLVGGAFDLASLGFGLIPKWRFFSWTHNLSVLALYVGLFLLIYSFIMSILTVYNIFIRFHYFLDHITWKHLPLISWIRRKQSASKHKPTYEYNPLKFSSTVEAGLKALLVEKSAEVRTDGEIRTLCIRAEHIQQANDYLVDLALFALSNDVTVQYLTASRHPIGFVESLKRKAEAAEREWLPLASKMIVIDAYSPHYAFLDSVYPKKTHMLESLGVSIVTAKALYAGIHTAAGKAFNILKEKANKEGRLPTLVIYEDPYALVDLESPDQYRIFVRHVLPSERLWVGMFTIVVETAQPDNDWKLLQAYADVVIDFTQGAPKGASAS